MFRQIEWGEGEGGVQNGPITKNRVFPVTNLLFGKFYLSLRTFYKELT